MAGWGKVMLNWLNDVAGPNYAPAILWTFSALLLLICVLVVIRLIRGLTFGTFVAGGRNRKTRLAVMDATAVDSHRRLVLIRRDDIEHLLLIGGPTDVVVVRDIRLSASRRPSLSGDAHAQHPTPAPRPQPAPAPQPVRQAPRQQPPSPPHASPAHASVTPIREAMPRPAPLRPVPTPPAHTPPHGAAAHPKAAPQDDIDDALMSELEVSLDEAHAAAAKPAAGKQDSLDDEMTKLLGELASHKR
jgi:hypothetical protein